VRSPAPDHLTEALACVAPDTSGGTAQHIPQPAQARRSRPHTEARGAGTRTHVAEVIPMARR